MLRRLALLPALLLLAAAPQASSNPLVLGDFELEAGNPVVDGDTIRVKGLDASLRLVGIDTEETFKEDRDRLAAEADFAVYAKAKRKGPRPAKYGTPLGMEATRWAQAFLADETHIRLEYDDPGRKRGYYGRHLVYVMVRRDGRWVNFNVEAVRAGMTPYFVKYGRSKRFHKQFVAAQNEARRAKRGIWSPAGLHYPDYDERLAWWARRDEAIERFRARHGRSADFVEIGQEDTVDRLLARMGQTVTVFAVLGDARVAKKPFLVPLSHRQRGEIYVVAFGDEELAKLELARWGGEPVYLRGKVSDYKGRPQIKAADVERIWQE